MRRPMAEPRLVVHVKWTVEQIASVVGADWLRRNA